MFIAILIATTFSLGFFVESIVGFGGSLLAYAVLGYFMDLKEMVLAALYIGTCSSSYIAYTGIKSFNGKFFKSALIPVFIGTILGTFAFSKLSADHLALILGILLIILSIKTIFFDKFILPKIFKNKLLVIGGISHGTFGIGGPFIANALSKDFKDKSELRTNMAIFFVIFNFVRIIQLSIQEQIKLDFFAQIWWTVIPVFIGIYLGYHVHLKISEKLFKKMIGLMTFLAGIKFLIG